jgi:hypothetical protein
LFSARGFCLGKNEPRVNGSQLSVDGYRITNNR